jgi:hypothetical protein
MQVWKDWWELALLKVFCWLALVEKITSLESGSVYG